MLVPREHGTWGEILFPLVAALAMGRPTWVGLALAGAALLGYLASEGVQTLLGWRGLRARREGTPGATVSVTLFGGCAVVAGAWGLANATTSVRAAALAALGLSAIVWGIAALGRLRTSFGESMAGAALSAWSVAVAVAGGIPLVLATGLWLVWAGAFAAATLAVRAVIARSTRRPSALTRVAAVLLALAPFVPLTSLAERGAVPGFVVAGFLPTTLATAAVCVLPIHARRLRWVGWAYVASFLVFFGAVVATRF